MSQPTQQLENLKELQSVRLSDAARTSITQELSAYSEIHKATVTNTAQPETTFTLFNWLRLHPAVYAMPFAALLLFVAVQYSPSHPQIIETNYVEPTVSPLPSNTTKSQGLYKTTQMNESMDASADSATMMAADPIDTVTQLQTTDARIAGLRTLIARYRLDIGEATYNSSLKNLQDATTHLSLASTKSGDAAAAELSIATELVAEVESNLSLLGTVTIDPKTGVIIAIDFSN